MTTRHNVVSRRTTRQTGRGVRLLVLACPLLALLGLYIFSSSFFLAKRSMPHVSSCDDARFLLRDTLGLTEDEIGKTVSSSDTSNGCWTDRRVDSMVIIVVDALRFDFALHHLPHSVGARLTQNSTTRFSQLLRFVADPPTVTMQRLKGLTTGGLPTFADISSSFGGASVDEDSWVQQLASRNSKLAFVGDDTWVDLFPTQFQDSHPFPSFNTRDIDSVDNGCLQHLPRLMEHLVRENNKDGFEVVVAHFLGVDHVGHTYGPHNSHMFEKLDQMDAVLGTVLDVLDDDSTRTCHAALIFGDHGMTEGGNHGGGTEDEINAALFAHFSRGCGDMRAASELTGLEAGQSSERAFQTIRQIDLVPTISVLLGLPIPYANLGGLVPSLLPPSHREKEQTPVLALALNAAQVWRYFSVYSQTANKLPAMPELEALLADAVHVFKKALEHDDVQDSIAYREACGKFKLFLMEAAELGIQVWTRFDTRGMIIGGAILFLSVILGMPIYNLRKSAWRSLPRSHYLEVAVSASLMLFHCVLLTFSNSYIDAEQRIVMFSLAVICITTCWRNATHDDKLGRTAAPVVEAWMPITIAVLSRVGELFVSGHGQDPSIPLHVSHVPAVFLFALAGLAMIRANGKSVSTLRCSLDMAVLVLLALAWLEKRSSNVGRNGYTFCSIVLVLLTIGIATSMFDLLSIREKGHVAQCVSDGVFVLLFRLLAAIVTVTGPSTASSALLFVIQAHVLYKMSQRTGSLKVSSLVLAALWRLTIRHVFFATNHACAFNRLQYSAAFVATGQFYFVSGGVSLFLNTFGWEIVGLIAVSPTSHLTCRWYLWKTYCFFQLLETLSACISVSLMRRHLMVWAIFAPRFIFAAIFLVLNAVAQLILFQVTKVIV